VIWLREGKILEGKPAELLDHERIAALELEIQ
jgi:hypothetical protein